MTKTIAKLVCIMVAVAFFASPAFAWDQAYHVKQAPNNKGDLLIFPGFFTLNGGWETKVTVTNTDETHSVIAKVILRSHYYTEELLDFLIYLSPRDVWTATLYNDGTNTYLYSEDDSILVTPDTFASPTNPVNKALYPVDCYVNDSTDRGYIEVVQTWYGDATNYAGGTAPPVSKSRLLSYYSPSTGPTAGTLAGRTGGAVDSDGIDHTINVLTGFMEIQNYTIPGMTASMPATVFADFDLTQYLNVGEVSGLNQWVGRNTLGELEAAMSKREFAMPYVNKPGEIALHMFNFPTKQAHSADGFDVQADGDCRFGVEVGVDGANGPVAFWDESTRDGCVTVGLTFFNLEEDSIETDYHYSGGEQSILEFCEEFQMESVVDDGQHPWFQGLYEEGWIEYTFDYNYNDGNTGSNTTPTPIEVKRWEDGLFDFSYTGIPVIPWVVFVKNSGLSMMYPAYEDGKVYARPTAVAGSSWLPEYQYWNYMRELGLNSGTIPANYPDAAQVGPWDLNGDGDATDPGEGEAADIPAMTPYETALP